MFERFLFRRAPLWFVLLSWLLGLLAMIAFGALVKHAMEGGRKFPAVSDGALALASIPSTIRQLFVQRNPALSPDNREPLPAGLQRAAGYDDDGYLLLSAYFPERERFMARIVRLRDGRVLHEYAPDMAAIHARSRLDTPLLNPERRLGPSMYRVVHPYLTPDGGLIFHSMSPLVRVDACGRIRWTLDGIFHHSIEPDADGNFWVPLTYPRSRQPHVSPNFVEDAIALVSPSGRLLREVSVAGILTRHGFRDLWQSRPYNDDPFHLNDIEPVRDSGPFWQRGDVFLSFRHLSLVLLYRPSTDRVIWSRQGPWSFQHDVTILDDHRISIFDNRARAGFDTGARGPFTGDWVEGHNRLLIADFASGRISSPYEAAFARRDLRTVTEGRGAPLANGDVFAEESNHGRIVRMDGAGRLRWRYIVADGEGRRYRLAWSRYLSADEFEGSVRAAASARCG